MTTLTAIQAALPADDPVVRYYREEWGFADRDAETMLLAKTFVGLGPVDGVWLDLGSGPTGPLWLPFVRPSRAVFADLHPHHLRVAALRHAAMRDGVLWPEERDAEALALELVCAKTDFEWRAPVEFVQHDNTHLFTGINHGGTEWSGMARLVTMIGCLGGLPDRQALSSALFHATGYVADGGAMVLAMWLRDRPLTTAARPAKFDRAPTLYSGHGVGTGLAIDDLASELKSLGWRPEIHTVETEALSPASQENATSRMVVAVCRQATR